MLLQEGLISRVYDPDREGQEDGKVLSPCSTIEEIPDILKRPLTLIKEQICKLHNSQLLGIKSSVH